LASILLDPSAAAARNPHRAGDAATSTTAAMMCCYLYLVDRIGLCAIEDLLSRAAP